MNDYRAKSKFKERIAQLQEWEADRPAPEFVGAAYSPPLEANTRKFVIDEIMAGLGWDMSRVTQQIVEEARVKGETTLFLDYLGVVPETRRPRLIMEAKAWAKPMIAWSSRGLAKVTTVLSDDPAGMVAAAINHIKAGGDAKDSPVIGEWASWLEKLRDYVRDVKAQSGVAVGRVAITSGRWLIIIANPQETLLDDRVVIDLEIRTYEGMALVECSEEIFDLLSRAALIGASEELLRPAEAATRIEAAQIARAFRGLWVARRTTGSYLRTAPMITVYPIILLDLSTGEKLAIHDHERFGFALPAKGEHVSDHVGDLEEASNTLLAELNVELGMTLVPSPLAAFQGFKKWDDTLSVSPVRDSSAHPGEFLAVTGEQSHYLFHAPKIAPCAAHGWGALRAGGMQFGATLVLRSSVEPAAYFADGDSYHCAHRTIHDRRANRCFIAPFEDYLCCRACVYQERCWSPEELAALPCGVAA